MLGKAALPDNFNVNFNFNFRVAPGGLLLTSSDVPEAEGLWVDVEVEVDVLEGRTALKPLA